MQAVEGIEAIEVIHTDFAPAAIGTYSQAIRVNNTVYVSGQIPLSPQTMEICASDISLQIIQVLDNLAAVCEAAGGSLQHIVSLTIYLVDLSHFPVVNEMMARYFKAPFPARATIGVAALPRGALVEMSAIMVLPSL